MERSINETRFRMLEIIYLSKTLNKILWDPEKNLEGVWQFLEDLPKNDRN